MSQKVVIYAYVVLVALLGNSAHAQTPNSDLLNAVKKTALRLEIASATIGYEAGSDPQMIAGVAAIKSALEKGASPDTYQYEYFKFIVNGFLYLDTSAFDASILIAGEMSDPSLVEMFLSHGADVHARTNYGWMPMDFALLNFDTAQTGARTKVEAAVQILQMLEAKGAKMTESEQAKKIMKLPNGFDLGDLAHELFALRILADLKLVSEPRYTSAAIGKPENRIALSHSDRVEVNFLKSRGAKLNDYSNELPSTTLTYELTAPETLASIAARFHRVMTRTALLDAARELASFNRLPFNTINPIPAGTKVVIPLHEGVDVAFRTPPDLSWKAVAKKIADDQVYFIPEATAAQILETLLALNGVYSPSKADLERELDKTTKIYVPYIRDRYEEFAPLKPPASYDQNRQVNLFVSESDRSRVEHDRHTYRVASLVGKALNPLVNFDLFHSWNEVIMMYPYSLGLSEAMRLMLNLDGSPLQDRIVFSHSMGIDSGARAEIYRDRKNVDNFDYNSIVSMRETFERAKPLIFHSAGNFNLSEGRFAPSYAIVHSPRTVMVGAVANYQGASSRIISPYSSQGADLCAPIPRRRGRWMEGTSFSTPLAAAIFRQFSEWYGNLLSADEIIAAALWTAEEEISDYVDVYGANQAALASDRKKLAEMPIMPAKSVANGAGLRNFERCGAGVLNERRWQEALDFMVSKKREKREIDSKLVPLTLVQGPSQSGSMEHVYQAVIPTSGFLGKLTFYLPQYRGRRSDVEVTTPKGFSLRLARSTTDVASSSAFSFEKVDRGALIVVKAGRALAPDASIQIRTYAENSVIADLVAHRRKIAGQDRSN